MALQVYRRIYDLAPTARDTEMALYRSARIMLTAFNDRMQAAAAYQELLRLFPNGDMAIQTRRALQQIL
jgi:tetratricopeptide (TPR) repeat protein